jgi:type I restriction enzyme, S subunit
VDVTNGYKQTEVGNIPADWSAVDYVYFGQVIDGDRGFQYPRAGECRDSGHCLFLNAGNVTKNGFRFAECQFISAEKDSRLNKGKLTRGDVVLTTRGTIGNFSYYNHAVPFEHIRINSGMVVLRNKLPAVSSDYLYLILRSRIVGAQLERLSFGSAQPQLTVKGISTLKIPLPPTRAEQEAIAEVLSDVDVLIEYLERLIAKKRDLKQGAMQELLTGKKRLAGFETESGLKQTEVGMIPADWQIRPLRFACTLHNGRAYALHEWKNAGVPVIRLQNLTGGKEYYYSDLKLSEHKYCDKGDLLFMWSATFGPHIWGGGRAIYHYHIWKISPTVRQATLNYLYYKLADITDEMKSGASHGGTMLHITKGEMESTPIALPSVEEQDAIASVLCDMDAEIAALDEKLAKARTLKQGMMQELLTGRIRLV